jgi:hypothetical protein
VIQGVGNTIGGGASRTRAVNHTEGGGRPAQILSDFLYIGYQLLEVAENRFFCSKILKNYFLDNLEGGFVLFSASYV